MNVARIPESLDTELLRRSAAGHSSRSIAEWLGEEKGITDCSHMTVARRLESLRLMSDVPAEATALELERRLTAQLRVLREIDSDLMDLQERSELPAEDERQQTFDRTKAVIFKRAQLAQMLFRHLASRLVAANDRDARRILDARYAEEDAREHDLLRLETTGRLVEQKLRLRRQTAAAKSAPPPASMPAARPAPKQSAAPQVSVTAVPGHRPCPCGSGRKYRKCHGKTPTVPASVTPTVPATVTASVTAAA